ncbi:MAG: hypothetical protein LM514_00045 [Streptococcus sp.]|nr:hypothetical protein [Streptococcus sp.]
MAKSFWLLFLFFQRKEEWIGLSEKHPDLFEKAKFYENFHKEHGRTHTWSQGELISRKIKGGFTEEIYQKLINDKSLIMKIVDRILGKFFPKEQHNELCAAIGLPSQENNVNDFRNVYQSESLITFVSQENGSAVMQGNNFIAYLNSLHNLDAGGANALAESQALNHYFSEIYEPFPLIDDIVQALTSDKDCVVIITGHAGDGKSTVSLDTIKKLRRLDPQQPLKQPLKERELIEWKSVHGQKLISIVKDMSELTADTRLQWINQAFDFHEKGSWLIISNTGPLLDTLEKYTKPTGNMESEILECLDQTYARGDLDPHTLQFSKPLIILNMARLDNVGLGARLLTRLINHSAWQQCVGCSAELACPLQLNRRALQATGAIAETRVRWIYQRLTAYEQRLTMRQMIAHLALSLTGGMSCDQAKQQASGSAEKSIDGLENILFSESFFGYRRGKSWPAAQNLRAVALIHRLVFGGPIAVDFERQLSLSEGMGWAHLPETLVGVNQRWRSLSRESAGVRWRFAQRRMAYLFGQAVTGSEALAHTFLDSFLQSPRLRDFDQWQQDQGFQTFNSGEQRRFCKTCLRVLLEVFSGFSAGQFQVNQDRLYLTLRRPDREIVQPTQLVIATLPFSEFELHYDPVRRLPQLYFRPGKIALRLPLPLLDYIQRRHLGELGSELARIHLAQLEWFRAELLRVTSSVNQSPGEIVLLRAGIDGQVYLHRYLLDEQKQRLERE